MRKTLWGSEHRNTAKKSPKTTILHYRVESLCHTKTAFHSIKIPQNSGSRSIGTAQEVSGHRYFENFSQPLDVVLSSGNLEMP